MYEYERVNTLNLIQKLNFGKIQTRYLYLLLLMLVGVTISPEIMGAVFIYAVTAGVIFLELIILLGILGGIITFWEGKPEYRIGRKGNLIMGLLGISGVILLIRNFESVVAHGLWASSLLPIWGIAIAVILVALFVSACSVWIQQVPSTEDEELKEKRKRLGTVTNGDYEEHLVDHGEQGGEVISSEYKG